MGAGMNELADFIEALNCGAMVIDRAGVIRQVNHRICEMTGFTRNEVLGRDVRTFYATDHCRQCVEELLGHFDDAYESEFGLPRSGGGYLHVILSGRPLPQGDGPAPFNLATFIDISALKESQRLLIEQRDAIAQMTDTVIAQAVALQRHARELEQRVRGRTADLRAANLDAIYMLAVASEVRDADTGAHVWRIEQHARTLALDCGVDEATAEGVGYAAVLHDVGKLYVPDHILQKPGPLDDAERSTMRLHTTAGERILSDRPFFATARRIARRHHENWDGSGYPDGLRGQAIPLEARIVHVVDVFDALTHARVYKQAWPAERAAAWIEQEAGAAFDPQICAAFLKLYRAGAIRDGGGGPQPTIHVSAAIPLVKV